MERNQFQNLYLLTHQTSEMQTLKSASGWAASRTTLISILALQVLGFHFSYEQQLLGSSGSSTGSSMRKDFNRCGILMT
jgi:hypothetical protein